MRQKLTTWQHHAKWIRQFHWTGRAVIFVTEIAIAYGLFLVGVFLALGVLSLW